MNYPINGRLAPTAGKQAEPIKRTQSSVTDSKYTTAASGGQSIQSRQPVGWEAITPKPTSKPVELLQAQTALQLAWVDYLAHIDAGADQGTLADIWDAYSKAKLDCEFTAHCSFNH